VRAVLGVDGGGSKTHALVADERGEVLGFASSGRSNWEDTGLEAAGAALAEAIGGALAAAQVPPGALAASAFGLAGLDWDPDRPMLGALLDPLGLAGPRRLENDSFIALRGLCLATGRLDEARDILREAPGLMVVDKREDGGYVTPIECVGDYATYVSRVREDPTVDNGLSLWCVSDNLRKGAALNAVQIAECLVNRKLIQAKRRAA